MHPGKFLFATILFILSQFTCAVQAQSTGTVSGTVQSEDGTKLPGVSVILKGTVSGTVTDVDGFFKLTVRKSGNHTLVISSVGYLSQSKAITVKNGQEIKVSFTMKSDSKNMDELTVHGKTETQEIKEQAFTVNAIETKRFANTTADLNQVLNKTAGVRVREEGGVGSDFNFSINGLSGKAVKFFLDGVPMELMGSAMSLNNIPVNLAERMEVYKGVVPVSLGSDALGGAVNIITNQNISNYLDASYSYGSFNTHRLALTGQYSTSKGIIIKASTFANYSDNNYMMRGMEIWDEAQYKYVNKDFKRFHDQYKSAMGQLEAGVINKKWADVLFVGFSYSGTKQDIQTGTRQDVVYGAVGKDGHAYNASLRYRKDNLFVKGLNANLFASRSVDNYVVTDTSSYKYYWDGSRVKTSLAEINGAKSITNINRPRTFARANLGYQLSDVHSFNVNYTYDHLKNENYNELITDRAEIPGILSKNILGAAYQQNLLNDRLTNTLFGKFYGISVQQSRYISTSGEYAKANDSHTYQGYGIASRYKILGDLGVKASYEKAYRLQEVGEMFGNGYTVIANLDLKPESSHNVNIGAYYGFTINKHKLFIEGSWFYRNANDFIYSVVYKSNSSVSRYENTSKVKVNGLEGDVKYNYGDLLYFNANVSYQNAINNSKYSPGSSGSTVEATYLNKIPNQPWLFGNADLSIGKNNILGKASRMQFNLGTQYVHWFYLTWEAFGSKASKSTIPDQYIHNASISNSWDNGRYNLSLECRNFTNNLAFDNFRLQKPGRAFSVKLRYFLR
ncbi:carboxypeptidase-like regulatory domain-containing protein [Dyadobacter sp. LHD-138]|uniref:TonB-dependent receptor n=1 Tax=Dyadobacter sp. LHD-138 TaxID=3071413 RepID=UPI0027E18935|nr:carboxypeptidase-like regulatory domain-containing protein [Dyadobacter sp. LHD-138]MDQ6480029.1 carboxypeptidase-like regulatory domain-containing protein [Dyadobacter sp. LHD-138]